MPLNEMKTLDLTVGEPAGDLACDEALLDACDSGSGPEVLRFWEPSEYFVVVGYANEVRREVNVEACAGAKVPVFRRCSGGGTVLQGPGCLNYTLILKIDESGPTESITTTNRYVMERNQRALTSVLGCPVEVRGFTDLTVRNLKFSGNAQRRKRKALIFHGTFLLDFELSKVQELLPMPSKEPDYRGSRPHEAFLTNLKVEAAKVKEAMRRVWGAEEALKGMPEIRELAAKYRLAEWNWKF